MEFTDKDDTPYRIEKPKEFLSREAIERRRKHGISIDERDLPVDPDYRDSIRSHPSVEVLHSSKWFNGITVHCPDSLHMDSLQRISFVEGTRRVRPLRIPDEVRPEAEARPIRGRRRKEKASWHEGIAPGYAERQLKMIELDHLMELGHRGEGIRIAVMDAGFPGVDRMGAFEHIFREDRYLGGFDAVEGDRYPFRANGHGRAVLSILAGRKENELLGSAPEASYLLCRTEDGSQEQLVEEHHWIAAAEFADSAGVDIISSSLGYTTFDDSSSDHGPSDMDGGTTPITKAADIAASRGMLVVNSAGNYGNSPWGIIGAPADGDSVLAVGSVDSTERYSSFSSKGPSADGRTKPDVMAMGEGTAFLGGDGKVYRGNGTSFSAPLISGAAACLWSAYPDMEPMELYETLEESAHLHASPNDSMGNGIPHLHTAYLERKGVEVAREGKARVLQVAPNPFHRNVELQVYSGPADGLTLSWYDPIGRLLGRREHPLEPEEHHEIRATAPSIIRMDGVFFLELRWNNGERELIELLHRGTRGGK